METTVAGIKFLHPFFNAAGINCTTEEQLEQLSYSFVGGLWTKTVTFVPGQGNPHPRQFVIGDPLMNTPLISGNSVGLANGGLSNMLSILKRIKAIQPCVLSIGGQADDLIYMAELAMDSPGVSAIEINISCPNVGGKGMLAFDFEELERVLHEIKATGINIPVGLKLPYYQDIAHFEQIVKIINDTDVVRFITCINGMPGLVLDQNNSQRVAANHGVAALGGDIVYPFALMNVSTFYRLFLEKGVSCDIIGCGGVNSAMDAFRMIWVGAKAVQVGTRLLVEIEKVGTADVSKFWEKLVVELHHLIKKHGEQCTLADIYGGYYKKGVRCDEPKKVSFQDPYKVLDDYMLQPVPPVKAETPTFPRPKKPTKDDFAFGLEIPQPDSVSRAGYISVEEEMQMIGNILEEPLTAEDQKDM